MITPEDPNEIKTFDPNMKTNHYESEGSYTLELVGQRRLLRQRRSGDPMDLTQAVESSLLAFINHSKYFGKPLDLPTTTLLCII